MWSLMELHIADFKSVVTSVGDVDMFICFQGVPSLLSIFLLSPPPSLAFLFSSVYVVLPSSMPFTHFVSIPLLFCGYHFCFCFLNVWKGMRLFKNTVDATRRVRSSWANVMEVCVSWIGVNCERGHGLISSSLSFMFFWRIVQFLNVSCKWPLLRLFK